MNTTESARVDHVNNSTAAAAEQPADCRMSRIERHLIETFDDLWDNYVDPADAVFDADGTRWSELGGGRLAGTVAGVPFSTEEQLREIRDQCRALASSNEFAINGHENRISYVVGSGHAYRVTAKGQTEQAASLSKQVQGLVDEFVRINHWHKRQQEIVRRRDRDGEVFLRLFPVPDGTARVRFVEPSQVAAPQRLAGEPSASRSGGCSTTWATRRPTTSPIPLKFHDSSAGRGSSWLIWVCSR